jgi:hypothetical protein
VTLSRILNCLLIYNVAVAYQHWRICRIALATSRLESGAHHAPSTQDEIAFERQVAEWLKEMMAVARGNPHAVSAPSIAAHALHRFAGRLREPSEQSDILVFLEEVDDLGWSTDSTQQRLRLEWGWLPREDTENSIRGLI